MEIVCTLRYRRHYYTVSGINSEGAKAECLQHANEEQQHADWIATRIVQLNGEPNFDPEGLGTRAHSEYNDSEDLVSMLKEDLYAERIAIESYSEIIRWLSDDDPTTRKLIEDILKVEEEHAEDLKSLLEKMAVTGCSAAIEQVCESPEKEPAANETRCKPGANFSGTRRSVRPWDGGEIAMSRRVLATKQDSLAAEILSLAELNTDELRERWKASYGKAPSLEIGRAFLTRPIAYRLQERTCGGLKPSTHRLLTRAVEETAGDLPKKPQTRMAQAGTILVREWQGTAHRVTMLADGVAFRGKRYRSLSEVARKITGSRWSGPRFFGLRSQIAENNHATS